MAEENYDVMISSKEYNELRNCKKEHAQLTQQNAKLTKRLAEVEKQLGIHRQELNRKKTENSYLLQMIQSIVCVEFIPPPSALETNKSASFQVLGESIFQPQKAEENKFNLQIAQMAKKYTTVIEKINQFNKQQQERDDQISQLKQTILQKQQIFNKLQAINQQSVDKKTKELLEFQKSKYDKKVHQLQNEILILKKKLNQAESELKKQLSDLSQFRKESKNIKVLLQKHKDQNNKLSGLLKDFSQRNKTLQREIDNLKKKGSIPSPNLQTIVKIKGLIDEHVREVQKNLKSIEGLSNEQIRNLVRSQLKQLMEYISKSIENKK